MCRFRDTNTASHYQTTYYSVICEANWVRIVSIGSCAYRWLWWVNLAVAGQGVYKGQDVSRHSMILLVDDDDTVRVTSADMLQELGYDVIQASGGVEALALLDDNRNVEVMVTDVRMPGMSGLELSEIAGGRFRDLKIILISGYFLPQPIRRRFLQKPFRTCDLDRAIRAELALVGHA